MTITVQQQATNADTAVTRTDLVRLLQEAGSPEQLDVTGQDLHGITTKQEMRRAEKRSELC